MGSGDEEMKVINCQTLGDMCEFMLDGEPVFLIRAQDKFAAEIVADYYVKSQTRGGKNTGRVKQQLDKITEWQKANEFKVKLPD